MYKCSCGWIGHTPKKRSKNKVQFLGCPVCTEVVQKYEIPLTERIGRCSNCGHGSFTNAIVKSHLLRCCKKCLEVVDTDDNMKIVRKGRENNE